MEGWRDGGMEGGGRKKLRYLVTSIELAPDLKKSVWLSTFDWLKPSMPLQMPCVCAMTCNLARYN